MHGATPIWLTAEVLAVMAWRTVVFASPLFVLAALWWLVDRTEWMIDRLFPNLEWERNLGWFNIRATRRAEAVLRALGYLIQATLAVALLGIVWGASDVAALFDPPHTWPVGEMLLRLPVMGMCVGVWLFYLGYWLIPKLRDERQLRGLNAYRREIKIQEEAIQALKAGPSLRVQQPQPKSVFEVTLTPSRNRRQI